MGRGGSQGHDAATGLAARGRGSRAIPQRAPLARLFDRELPPGTLPGPALDAFAEQHGETFAEQLGVIGLQGGESTYRFVTFGAAEELDFDGGTARVCLGL